MTIRLYKKLTTSLRAILSTTRSSAFCPRTTITQKSVAWSEHSDDFNKRQAEAMWEEVKLAIGKYLTYRRGTFSDLATTPCLSEPKILKLRARFCDIQGDLNGGKNKSISKSDQKNTSSGGSNKTGDIVAQIHRGFHRAREHHLQSLAELYQIEVTLQQLDEELEKSIPGTSADEVVAPKQESQQNATDVQKSQDRSATATAKKESNGNRDK